MSFCSSRQADLAKDSRKLVARLAFPLVLRTLLRLLVEYHNDRIGLTSAAVQTCNFIQQVCKWYDILLNVKSRVWAILNLPGCHPNRILQSHPNWNLKSEARILNTKWSKSSRVAFRVSCAFRCFFYFDVSMLLQPFFLLGSTEEMINSCYGREVPLLHRAKPG
jgi:hypothetical protein